MLEVRGDGARFGARGKEVIVCFDICARKKGVSVFYDCREGKSPKQWMAGDWCRRRLQDNKSERKGRVSGENREDVRYLRKESFSGSARLALDLHHPLLLFIAVELVFEVER